MNKDSIGREINPGSHAHKVKHQGWSKHRATYQCWQDMKQRCYNQNSAQYKNYGARGIYVCDRWRFDFAAFFDDMGEKPQGMTLDRIDNNGIYSPQNCRWATHAEQRVNQRSCVFLELHGKRMTIEEWGRELGRHPTTIRGRIRAGWKLEDILSPDLKRMGRVSMLKKYAAIAQGKGEK